MARDKKKAKTKGKVEDPTPQPIKPVEKVTVPDKSPEEKCFHEYQQHLKRLQGGDYQKPSLVDCGLTLKYPSSSELAAFLDIGAEAERRNELHFQEMKCCIDNLTRENDNLRKENVINADTTVSLKKKISENENVIMSLTTEIDQLNCRLLKNKDVQNLTAQFECERDQLLQENERINCQIKHLKWNYCKLKEEHENCSKNEAQDAKNQKILQLTECLEKKDIHLRKITCELQELKDKKCALELKVASLEDQLQSQCQDFARKSCTYEKAINDLECQITFLEQTLTNKENANCIKKQFCEEIVNQPLNFQEAYIAERLSGQDRELHDLIAEKENNNCINDQVYEEIVKQPLNLPETYIADQLSEQDRLLQELIAKIELRDKNFQKLKNLQNSQCMISEEEYATLGKLIEEQACEIDQLTSQLQRLKGEDSCSSGLLDEVAELQNAVCDSGAESPAGDNLSKRIKRIKCKIKSRIQREEARRKEQSRQLGLYRCQFVTLQKEIEELRHTNPTTAKDDIKIRVEKEKALSQVICHINKQRRELHSKINSLEKALANIEKVNEFLVQIS